MENVLGADLWEAHSTGDSGNTRLRLSPPKLPFSLLILFASGPGSGP